ncbi:hypothetical protein M3Y99_00559400 [Aphelenchoides fujianensis]|nr:hypothetical protein M3Y99_00559400 [Aphelenchoides fujianensis]
MATQIDQMIDEFLHAGKQAPTAAPVRSPLPIRTFNSAFKQTPAASPTHFPTPRDTPAATPLREHIPAPSHPLAAADPTSPNVQQLKSDLAAERKLNKSQGLKLITRDRKILKQKETINKQTIEIRDVKKAARKEAAESKKTIGQQGRTIKRQERELQKARDLPLSSSNYRDFRRTPNCNLIYKQENRHLNRMLATKDKAINHLVQREKKMEKAFNQKLKKVAAECEEVAPQAAADQRRGDSFRLPLTHTTLFFQHKKTKAKLRGLPSAAVYARERRQHEEHCQELEEAIGELRARLEEREREQANVNSAAFPPAPFFMAAEGPGRATSSGDAWASRPPRPAAVPTSRTSGRLDRSSRTTGRRARPPRPPPSRRPLPRTRTGSPRESRPSARPIPAAPTARRTSTPIATWSTRYERLKRYYEALQDQDRGHRHHISVLKEKLEENKKGIDEMLGNDASRLASVEREGPPVGISSDWTAPIHTEPVDHREQAELKNKCAGLMHALKEMEKHADQQDGEDQIAREQGEFLSFLRSSTRRIPQIQYDDRLVRDLNAQIRALMREAEERRQRDAEIQKKMAEMEATDKGHAENVAEITQKHSLEMEKIKGDLESASARLKQALEAEKKRAEELTKAKQECEALKAEQAKTSGLLAQTREQSKQSKAEATEWKTKFEFQPLEFRRQIDEATEKWTKKLQLMKEVHEQDVSKLIVKLEAADKLAEERLDGFTSEWQKRNDQNTRLTAQILEQQKTITEQKAALDANRAELQRLNSELAAANAKLVVDIKPAVAVEDKEKKELRDKIAFLETYKKRLEQQEQFLYVEWNTAITTKARLNDELKDVLDERDYVVQKYPHVAADMQQRLARRRAAKAAEAPSTSGHQQQQ